MSRTNSDSEEESQTASEYADEWIDNEEVKSILQESLDEVDYQIYRILNRDGRISDTEIAEQVNLSRTAVRRRREKL